VRSGASVAEEAAPAAAAGERMAANLGKASVTQGAKAAVLDTEQVVSSADAADALGQVRRNESTIDEGREFMARRNGSPNTSRMAVSDAAKAMIENINSQLEEAGALTRASTQT